MNLFSLMDSVIGGNPALVFLSFVFSLVTVEYIFISTLDMYFRYKLERIILENKGEYMEYSLPEVSYMTEEEIRELKD